MSDALVMLPVVNLQAQMQGLVALGLDMQRIRARVGPLPLEPDAMVPLQAYLDMWDEAQAVYGKPGLPTALAMAIPFGAFGALDYLVGSASSVGGMVESAVLHFAMVASDCWLECDSDDRGLHVVRVRAMPWVSVTVLEYTLAIMLSRLRYLTNNHFRPLRVALPGPKPPHDPAREQLVAATLEYNFPGAEIVVDVDTWEQANPNADPYLHATLKRLAAQLGLDSSSHSPLEQALRMRLRGALAQGRADPARVATLLGVSQRSLQRRLQEAGRSFSEVLEDFRRDESAHLLCNPDLSLVEIAFRLGYTEQTSFTRAFRRWTGTTPGAWRTARSSGPDL
jgi:AraC-like DNA-binding protein